MGLGLGFRGLRFKKFGQKVTRPYFGDKGDLVSLVCNSLRIFHLPHLKFKPGFVFESLSRCTLWKPGSERRNRNQGPAGSCRLNATGAIQTWAGLVQRRLKQFNLRAHLLFR